MVSTHVGKPKKPKPYPGLFITFEGPEGSGKTTQCHYVAQWLQTDGHSVLITREPGGTPLAEAIRNLLLGQRHSPNKQAQQEVMTPACEAALVLAARAQHVTQTIIPALQKGRIVLCDRFFDSTLAYQGFGRGLDRKALAQFNDFVTGGLTPTLTFLLDLPIKEGLLRRNASSDQNRMDRESLAFHERVRRGFATLARENPTRWRTLDARQTPEPLANEIINHIRPFVPKRTYERKKTTASFRRNPKQKGFPT